MLRWKELVRYSDEELGKVDIAEVNLAYAEGLPYAPNAAAIRSCIHKLNDWTRLTRRFTDLGLAQFFRPDPAKYDNSEALYRAICLVTALQRHCGLRYNPAKIPEDAEFDSRDTFIHGAILGQGGTCASIPVIVAAVGRRLGYPIKLVNTKGKKYGHCFARWDDPNGERLNLEATNTGLSTPEDDYYRTGRYALTQDIEKAGLFLRSQTPRQEFGYFLAERACHWRNARNWRQAAESQMYASEMDPENDFHSNTMKIFLNAWYDELEAMKPPGFPPLYIHMDGRRFPTLELRFENDALGKAALDNVLKDQNLIRKYWEPMRRGLTLLQVPDRIIVRYKGDQCHVAIEVSYPAAVEYAR